MENRKYFWGEGLFVEDENGMHLLGSKCKKCGQITFPQNDICHNCLSQDMEETRISQTGYLHTWTITRVPVGKFPQPHALGVISFPEERVRVTAPLIYQDSYEIGKPMKIEKAKYYDDEDGTEVWGYKFRPVED